MRLSLTRYPLLQAAGRPAQPVQVLRPARAGQERVARDPGPGHDPRQLQLRHGLEVRALPGLAHTQVRPCCRPCLLLT